MTPKIDVGVLGARQLAVQLRHGLLQQRQPPQGVDPHLHCNALVRVTVPQLQVQHRLKHIRSLWFRHRPFPLASFSLQVE